MQKIILFYLYFEPKFFILKIVIIILKFLHFNPKLLQFFFGIQIFKLFIFYYFTLIIVDLMCRMDENNNVVEEIMKDDFEEGVH